MQQRTALSNRIRGLLSEFGIVLPLKAATVRREAHKVLKDLPLWCNKAVGDMLSELTHLDERIKAYDNHIARMAGQSEQAGQLMKLAGIDPPTATALIASIGRGRDFACGRQLCAWLSLMPGQHSSGPSSAWGVLQKRAILIWEISG